MTASQIYHRLAAWFVQAVGRLPNPQEARQLAEASRRLAKA